MQTHRRITNLVLLFSRTGDLSRDHGNFTKCTREVYLEAKLFYLFKALSLKAGFSVHDTKMKDERVSVRAATSPLDRARAPPVGIAAEHWGVP